MSSDFAEYCLHIRRLQTKIARCAIWINILVQVKLDAISGVACCIRDTSVAARRILGDVVESLRERRLLERRQTRCQKGVRCRRLTEYMYPSWTSDGEY
jgi:hypothetical protein